MKRVVATVLAAAATLGAMPALAGGLAEAFTEPSVIAAPAVAVAPAGAAAPNVDWSGFYLGAQLGSLDIVASDKSFNGKGSTKGLIVGFRKDFGKLVIGVEGNHDRTNIDLNGGAVTVNNVTRLKLIGGYDLGPALLYGAVAAVRAKTSIGSDSGYAFGAGVDYAVTGRITVGTEILKHSFDDFSGSGINLDATTVNARVAFRF